MLSKDWLTKPHNEADFQAAGLIPVERKKQDVASWRLITKFVQGAMDYTTVLTSDIPELNGRISKITDKARTIIYRHYLKDASHEQLEQWLKETENLLSNVNIHDTIVSDFALKNLFLGKNSFVLSGYSDLRKDIRSHLNAIVEQIATLPPRVETTHRPPKEEKPSKPEKAVRSKKGAEALASKAEKKPLTGMEKLERAKERALNRLFKFCMAHPDLNVESPEVSKEMQRLRCLQTNLRPNYDDPLFETYLDIHYKLYHLSPTYKNIVDTVKERGMPDYGFPPGTPVTISSRKNYPFAASWDASKHSIIITIDHAKNIIINEDKQDKKMFVNVDEIENSITFEITNAFQQPKFAEVRERALNREFEISWGLDADHYVVAMENIERDGFLLQLEIQKDIGFDDREVLELTHPGLFKKGLGHYLNRHGDSYRNYYVTYVRPELDKVPDSELTMVQRMHRDAQRSHWIPKLEGKKPS